MPHEQITTATVKDDGTLHGKTAGQTLIQWLNETFQLFSGGRVEISVSRPTRTLRQNRRYWALLSDIAEAFRRAGVTELHMVSPQTGEQISLPMTKDLLHRWMKNKHLTPKDPGAEPSTTNLDQTEMTDYMERIMEDEEVRQLDITFREEDRIAHA